MKLDVHVGYRTVAQLYRERDEYVLRYLPGTEPNDFVSLAMPVREEPWRWTSVAKQMVHAWNEGLSSLNDHKNQVLNKALDAAIAKADFSAPEQPEQDRTIVGRSDLLAPRRKY